MTVKIFRPVIFAGLFATLTPHAVAAEAQSTTPASVKTDAEQKIIMARQIVDIGYPEHMREEVFFGAMDQMVTQMREAMLNATDIDDEDALTILDEWTDEYMHDSKKVLRSHLPSIMNAMVQSYANMFTQQELADISQFVSTPSGQRFFELSPKIMSDPNFAAANQAYMNEVMAKLPAARERLKQRLLEHFTNKAVRNSSSKD